MTDENSPSLPYRLQLEAGNASDTELDLERFDKAVEELRHQLVRRRYFSCLKKALEQSDAIDLVRFDPVMAGEFVRPAEGEGRTEEVLYGWESAQSEAEHQWKALDRVIGEALDRCGASPLEALSAVLPTCAQGYPMGLTLPRQEVIALCARLLQNPSTVFDRATRQQVALERHAALGLPMPKPRL